MEDLPVSFSWVYPSVKNGICTAYCFAYVRDPKNYNVLYAGVKYEGKINELNNFRIKLRRTAVKRLLRKPIFAVFSVGNDENYQQNLTNKKYRFNGITNGSLFSDDQRTPKKTVSLGKFFLYCAMNQQFSDLGIYTKKDDADLKLVVNGEKIENYKYGMEGNIIYLKYGYECRGEESKRITGASLESIISLRKRSKFFGKGKVRRSLDDYFDLSDEYLMQFGFNNGDEKPENKTIRLSHYQKDKRVIFYKMNLSNRVRAHIALMPFENWVDYVGEVTDKPINVNVCNENMYSMAYSIENIDKRGTKGENKWRKNLHRQIAINRLIENPNIIETEFFDDMNMKDIRMWFGRRIMFFPVRGERRLNFQNGNFNFKASEWIMEFEKYDERVYLYLQDNSVLPKFVEKIFKFFGLI